MKHRYNPVKAIRYHFTEFNILVSIFVAMNGGLLAAYSSDGLKCDLKAKIFISILGIIVSFLFFCCSRIYNLCVTNISDSLNTHFKEHLPEFINYPPPFRYAKESTTKVFIILSLILTITWEILIFYNIYAYKGSNDLIVIIAITTISLAAYIYLWVLILLKTCFNNFKKNQYEMLKNGSE